MSNLNLTLNPINAEERRKINQNWTMIMQRFSNLQSQLNVISGDVSVEEIISDLTVAIQNANQTVQEITNTSDQLFLDVSNRIQSVDNKLLELQTALDNSNSATSDARDVIAEARTAISEINAYFINFSFLGEYQSDIQYRMFNFVRLNKDSYVSLKNNLGITPSDDGINWRLVATGGADGSGAVSTVNGVSPQLDGNVILSAEDLNAATQMQFTQANNEIQVLKNRADIIDVKDTKNQLNNYNINNSLNKLYRGEPLNIVLVGDSLTFGSGASREELDWASLFEGRLKRKFPNSNITITNSAVGGTNTDYLRDNWNSLVAAFNPDLIIISHGTNDVGITLERRRQNYDFFINQSYSLNSEVLLVTNSTVRFIPAPYGNQPGPDVLERDIIAEQTREIAKYYKIGLCDANKVWHKWLTDHNTNTSSTLLHYDHIHPNDLGHKIIAYSVFNAFNATTDSVIELDDRYGGKNWYLNQDVTFRDLAHIKANKDGWGAFDLNHQLVDYGGLWSIKNYYNDAFKKARLWGTRAITGQETYENNYVDDMTILPLSKDFIELEVMDVKRVWIGMSGTSEAPVRFYVIVDGIQTQVLQISNISNAPIEISFKENNKFFSKGKHTIRIERVDNVLASQYIQFNGFLVNYYDKNEPEIFGTPSNSKQIQNNVTYSTYDQTFTNRNQASNGGVISPFGWSDFDGSFIQVATGKPGVISAEFYGKTCTVVLKGITTINYANIYIDGILKEVATLVDPNFGDLTFSYSGLGENKHKLEIVSIDSQINLVRLKFSDTL